ncbi:hypothetical protein [Sediminibacterium sp.]|uniref:hypothetical protein n=1 Tax=Sediminibacterium sp. TaxID=1917865 RepID=UPI00273500BE|nr:hypothetical protein [Sediminibacterium sp.]MDP3566606.1 hypothetical protein [Sediminibacterium sp.]
MPTLWDAYDGDVYVDSVTLDCKTKPLFQYLQIFFQVQHIPVFTRLFIGNLSIIELPN